MKKNICLLFLILAGLAKAQNHEKIIPLVLYNPARFTIAIEEAFVLKSQYIRTDTTGDNINYFIKLDESRNKERKTTRSSLAQKGINLDLLNTPDSTFMVIIEPFNYYGSKFQIYGRKFGGKYTFRRSNGTGGYQSFGDLIKKIYGVPEVFALKYLKSQEEYITYGWNNGLLEADLNNARRLFEEDYVLYQVFNPSDTTRTIDLLVQLIARFTILTPQQKTSLNAKIWDDARKYPSKQKAIDQIARLKAKAQFMLSGADLETILPQVLTPDQLSKVLVDLRAYCSKRNFYYTNMRAIYPAYKDELGDRFLLSDEGVEILAKLIFENKSNGLD
jgi:hypothetical protein